VKLTRRQRALMAACAMAARGPVTRRESVEREALRRADATYGPIRAVRPALRPCARCGRLTACKHR
jgi:hypothetical protein